VDSDLLSMFSQFNSVKKNSSESDFNNIDPCGVHLTVKKRTKGKHTATMHSNFIVVIVDKQHFALFPI